MELRFQTMTIIWWKRLFGPSYGGGWTDPRHQPLRWGCAYKHSYIQVSKHVGERFF